jgi:hypothetical protein
LHEYAKIHQQNGLNHCPPNWGKSSLGLLCNQTYSARLPPLNSKENSLPDIALAQGAQGERIKIKP